MGPRPRRIEAVDNYVYERVRHFPETAAQGAIARHRQFSDATVSSGSWGAAASCEYLRAAAVSLLMKSVGKPDAGNGHVRFDERGRETGRCQQAQATAPFLDSTKRTSGPFWPNELRASAARCGRSKGNVAACGRWPVESPEAHSGQTNFRVFSAKQTFIGGPADLSRKARCQARSKPLDQRHGGGRIALLEAADHVEEDVARRFLRRGWRDRFRDPSGAARRPSCGALGPGDRAPSGG